MTWKHFCDHQLLNKLPFSLKSEVTMCSFCWG